MTHVIHIDVMKCNDRYVKHKLGSRPSVCITHLL